MKNQLTRSVQQDSMKNKKIQWMIIGVFFVIYLIISFSTIVIVGSDDTMWMNMKTLDDCIKLSVGWTGKFLLYIIVFYMFHIGTWSIKLLNAVFVLLLSTGVYKFCSLDKCKYKNCALIFCLTSVFLLPLCIVSCSISWLTGSMVYLWPVTAGVWVLNYIKDRLDIDNLVGDKNKKRDCTNLFFILLTSILACNQEHFSLVLVCFGLCAIIYHKVNYKKYDINLLILYGVILITSAVTWISPGNKLRYLTEMKVWYPEFGNLTWSCKIIQAILWSLNSFVNVKFLLTKDVPLIMLLITGIIFVVSLINKLSKPKMFLISLPFIYFLNKSLFDPQYGYKVFGLMSTIPGESINNLLTLDGKISVFLIVSVMFLIIYGLYEIILDLKLKLITIGLFIGAFFSHLVIGFSPTIFASGPRTFFAGYVLLILVLCILIKKIFDLIDNDRVLFYGMFVYVSCVGSVILHYVLSYSKLFVGF